MFVRRDSEATPTPKIRAAIQARDEPAWILEERHATTEQTVWKWRKRNRDSVQDRSRPPPRLQTTLTRAQQAVAGVHCAKGDWGGTPPFLMGSSRRIHAAVFSFTTGVMPPMPMLGRSLL
jgi:hypothetical protein